MTDEGRVNLVQCVQSIQVRLYVAITFIALPIPYYLFVDFILSDQSYEMNSSRKKIADEQWRAIFRGETRVLFHFRKTSANQDEWLDSRSGRIKPSSVRTECCSSKSQKASMPAISTTRRS